MDTGTFRRISRASSASPVSLAKASRSLALSAAEGRAALRGVRVFDHPGRSQRGRVITHAHCFELDLPALPPVQGADDARAAAWVSIDTLTAREDRFFDDHFHILDTFLGLLADRPGE